MTESESNIQIRLHCWFDKAMKETNTKGSMETDYFTPQNAISCRISDTAATPALELPRATSTSHPDAPSDT